MHLEFDGKIEPFGANPLYWFGIGKLKDCGGEYVAVAVGQPPSEAALFFLIWDDDSHSLSDPDRSRVVTGATEFVNNPENGYGGMWTAKQMADFEALESIVRRTGSTHVVLRPMVQNVHIPDAIETECEDCGRQCWERPEVEPPWLPDGVRAVCTDCGLKAAFSCDSAPVE